MKGIVVVDESLWAHEYLEGTVWNRDMYDSQVWLFGLTQHISDNVKVFVVENRTA